MTTVANATPTSSPDALHELSNEDLDALPYGVIALDEEARIVRYNVAEARFARLDRTRVVGRSFFDEIARCTKVPEFHGRYVHLLEIADTPVVRFSFVFAFRFGAQAVDIEMGRSSRARLVYITVNRRKFLPRESEVPASLEAPLLVELEPEAENAGVLRDEQGRRKLEVEAPLFEALFSTLNSPTWSPSPADTAQLLRSWGSAWGRIAVVDLQADALQSKGASLGELTMAGAVAVMAGYLRRQRLGGLTVDFAHAGRGAIVVAFERSFFAELGAVSGCPVVEGLLGVLLGHLARRLVVVRETRCTRRGAAFCEFVAMAATRAGALERAAEGLALPASEVIDRVMAEVRREPA